MNKVILGGVLLAAMCLAACGGGGSTTTPSTPKPTSYQVSLHWEPASNVGLGPALAHRMSDVHVLQTIGGGTDIVVGSGNGGSGVYDPSGDPAYVTVSVSPEPSPQATVAFTTTATNVVIQPTPTLAPGVTPNPSFSPAIVLASTTANTASTGSTVSATVAGTTATDNLAIYPMLTLIAMAPGNGSPVAPDAVGFTFDSNCNITQQTSTAASDIYITYATSSYVTYPGGGIAFSNGYDVTTLTASQWQNAGTSVTLDAMSDAIPSYDTIIFKAPSSGKIVFIGVREWGGDAPTAGAADIEGLYGCLN
jgi:hypothetical protein